MGLRAIVVSGGPVGGPAPLEPADDDLVIAADSGLDVAQLWGWSVDVVVGDLDSVSAAALARIDAATSVERHPATKDEIDLELALGVARRCGAAEVIVVATAKGRLDHAVAIFSVLGSDRWASMSLRAHVDGAEVRVVRPDRLGEVVGPVGSLVSLMPVHGDAHGVTTTGLRFPLRGETLRSGAARGVSNEMAADRATVALSAGTILVVQPGDA